MLNRLCPLFELPPRLGALLERIESCRDEHRLPIGQLLTQALDRLPVRGPQTLRLGAVPGSRPPSLIDFRVAVGQFTAQMLNHLCPLFELPPCLRALLGGLGARRDERRLAIGQFVTQALDRLPVLGPQALRLGAVRGSRAPNLFDFRVALG